jgi:hypothetical protein
MAWGAKVNDMGTGVACTRCSAPVAEGQKVCECGRPTLFMGFKERAAYEVEQYRAYKARDAAVQSA